MLRIDVIASGKMRNTPFATLWNDYAARMAPWNVNIIEIEGKNQAEEHLKLAAKLDPRAHIFVLDEKGKSLRSMDFASRLDKLAAGGENHIQFVIGGADGLSDELRKKANFLLSFGVQTWPHMMVRVMLLEQLYRARQILAGHPYHRE